VRLGAEVAVLLFIGAGVVVGAIAALALQQVGSAAYVLALIGAILTIAWITYFVIWSRGDCGDLRSGPEW
jgi:hypothetical protein